MANGSKMTAYASQQFFVEHQPVLLRSVQRIMLFEQFFVCQDHAACTFDVVSVFLSHDCGRYGLSFSSQDILIERHIQVVERLYGTHRQEGPFHVGVRDSFRLSVAKMLE